MRAEPNDWIKKYFTAASISPKFFIWIIKGIKPIKFISNPHQTKKILLLLKEIKTPKTIKNRKKKELGKIYNIRKRIELNYSQQKLAALLQTNFSYLNKPM